MRSWSIPNPGNHPSRLLIKIRNWARFRPPIRWLTSTALLGCVLVMAVFFVYRNALDGGWLYDDHADILGNPAVQKIWPLKEHFLRKMGAQTGVVARPVVTFTFALNYWAGKNNPFGYHLVNVCIHALASLAMFGLVRQTMLRLVAVPELARNATTIGFLCALLWGIHPLNTESVAYITQRYESLMGLFFLLTLWCLARSVESPRRKIWMGLSAACCLLALESKEVAAGLPLIILLYDKTYLSGSFISAWRTRRLFYLAIIASIGIFLLNQLNVVGRGWAGYALDVSWWKYALNQSVVILHYIKLSIWPHPLVLDYGWTYVESWVSLVPYVVLMCGIVIITIIGVVKWPMVGFLPFSFFIVLAPTSSVMPILDLAVEHRMYIPLLFLIIFVVVFCFIKCVSIFNKTTKLKKIIQYFIVSCVVMVFVVFGCLTYLRGFDYQNSCDMWFDTISKRPNNPRAYSNYAHALREKGNIKGAIKAARIGLDLAPTQFETMVNLGGFLALDNQYDEAERVIGVACTVRPRDPRPWINLSMISRKRGTLAKARECSMRALELAPGDPQVLAEMGSVLTEQGDFTEGIRFFRKATEVRPGYSLPRWGAGKALLRLGRKVESLSEFDAYVALEPDRAEALTGVGQALSTEGLFQEALVYWQKALGENPYHIPSLLLSSWLYSTCVDGGFRDGNMALLFANRALAIKGTRDPVILEAVASAYAQLNQFDKACLVLEEAIKKFDELDHSDNNTIKNRLEKYKNKTM